MDKDVNCNEHALSKFIECLDWFSWLSCGIPNQRQTQNQLPKLKYMCTELLRAICLALYSISDQC